MTFMSPPPHPTPYCYILTNDKKYSFKIYFCSHIYFTTYQKNRFTKKKDTLPNLCHHPHSVSVP